ncbi:MAG: tRNA pseudouridine(55) synthase TruB [Cryobacterium sp.]|nr:tRNA pseudouridine(55) synthase TruB [Oligoflexia bacterium]
MKASLRVYPEALRWLDGLHGFLLVDKSAGMTSQDVITRMQRTLLDRAPASNPVRKRDLPKMGHGGTLDPFATGLLVIAVGDGTKLARYLIDSEKSYEATVEFGARTASGDLTNEITERTDCLPESESALESAASSFTGQPYLQLPPMYSAKKIDGQPLYELARKGIEVERALVSCKVPEFKVLESFRAGAVIQRARIRARVSSGTYIRTLAEDFAIKLGSLAFLSALRRISSGKSGTSFEAKDSLTLEQLALSEDWTDLSAFIPFERCLVGRLPRFELTDDQSRAIIHGLKSMITEVEAQFPPSESHVALYHQGELRAVFVRNELGWDFERVFHPRTERRAENDQSPS